MNTENSFNSDNAFVTVDEKSYLAQWTYWQSRHRNQNLSAIEFKGQKPMLFIENEILVDSAEVELINELEKLYEIKIIKPRPIPPRPAGMGEFRNFDISAMPVTLRLQFIKSPQIKDACPIIGKYIFKAKEFQGHVTIASEYGASIIALVGMYKSAGRHVGLNGVGYTQSLPLYSASEWVGHPAGGDPFKWKCFSGRSRITHAWQMIESYRQLKNFLPSRKKLIGILDSGFWLDDGGNAFVPLGQSESDFGIRPFQLNLLDYSAPAGGENGIGNEPSPWHGNGTASVAAGTVGNSAGTAGSGATIALPVLFKTDCSIYQILNCLQICLEWGVDILNMSFEIDYGVAGYFFPKDSWESTFQFAADNGLIMIAAAGNDNEELPDHVVRPATRTPGVITVGALEIDPNNSDYTQKAGFSNYGSSVGIWAPGVDIPIAPDGLTGTRLFITDVKEYVESGTSRAAPLVAGVAAMMRYIDNTLTSGGIQNILSATGFRGTNNVGPCMDAFAAIFACMGNQLPSENEPNDSYSQARALVPIGTGGWFGPNAIGISALSHAGDVDYWLIPVNGYSTIEIRCEWYRLLSTLYIELLSDDPDGRTTNDLQNTYSITNGSLTIRGKVAPGVYRLRIAGSDVTAYRLQVRTQPSHLEPDIFEPNDNYVSAATLQLKHFFRRPVFGPGPKIWGPGIFDATLTVTTNAIGLLSMNADYFRLDVPLNDEFLKAVVEISDTDYPVNVALSDAKFHVMREWINIRKLKFFPEPNSISFLIIFGNRETRYKINVGQEMHLAEIPRAIRSKKITPLPPWWDDPLIQLHEKISHYLVNPEKELALGNRILFQPTTEPLQLDLLDHSGNEIRHGNVLADGRHAINIQGLEPGKYILRVSRGNVTGKKFANQSTLNLRLAPPAVFHDLPS